MKPAENIPVEKRSGEKSQSCFTENQLCMSAVSSVSEDQCAPSGIVPLIALRNTLVASWECITKYLRDD